MFGRIILWSALWITVLCIWFPQKNEAKFKKNLALGVTLPPEARDDPQVAAILRRFRRETDISCLVMGILSVAGVFLSDLTTSLVCWTVLLAVMIVLPMGIYAAENRKMKALKKERGWVLPHRNRVRVDAGVILDYPRPKLWGYLFCAAVCVPPMLLQHKLWWVHLMDLGLVGMSYAFAALCYRKRAETVDSNAERTRALSLLRYRKWKQIWLLSAVCGVMVSYSLWIMDLSHMVGMCLLIGTSILLCAAMLGLEMQTRRQQEQLTKDTDADWYADEDDYWLGGQFYCNPNDSHLLVNARTGTGSTVNLATAGGKILSGLCLLLVAGSLVLLIALAVGDKSEIRLEYAGETVSCENGSTHYAVPVSEIESAELVEQLPESMWRTWGTGGQYLTKGSFTANGLPDLMVIADPTCPPFLIIQTADGTAYLLGSRDPARTAAVYAELAEHLVPNPIP